MEIPGTGGLKAVFIPGHTQGHTVYLFPNAGAAHETRPRVLFLGDEIFHISRLAWGFVYEDFPKAREALGRMCALDFDVACFGHGRPLAGKAAERIRAAF
jgi:glyoxylase-like metal-dependent hydrolase (beta-lactamase superfamily II)